MKGHAIVYNIGASAYVNPIATFEYPYYYRVIASIGAKYCTHIIIIIWDTELQSPLAPSSRRYLLLILPQSIQSPFLITSGFIVNDLINLVAKLFVFPLHLKYLFS